MKKNRKVIALLLLLMLGVVAIKGLRSQIVVKHTTGLDVSKSLKTNINSPIDSKQARFDLQPKSDSSYWKDNGEYVVDNFDNDLSQWEQFGVPDGAWWDAGNPETYQIGISTNICYSSPASLWIDYQKHPGGIGKFFQVDLTADPANHVDWVNPATGENALVRLMVMGTQPNTEVQFQLSTGTGYWTNWTESYLLPLANHWYAVKINWNNYNNAQGNNFNAIRRMNFVIDPSSGTSSGRIYIDSFSSLDASVPAQPDSGEIITKLGELKSYFGTSSFDIHPFLKTVLDKTFNYFVDPNAMNLTHGLPRTGYNPYNLSEKGHSNPTEWGYYLNALIIGRDFEYISSDDFHSKIRTSLNTILTLQATQGYQGQFFAFYYVKNIYGNNIFPIQDVSQNFLPSIDNAFLAGSLKILREYAFENCFSDIAILADSILSAMDFRMYWDSTRKQFSHGLTMPGGSFLNAYWDVYANETHYLTELAAKRGDITALEMQENLSSLNSGAGWYVDHNDFTIVVNPCNWDGSLFTYLMPGIFMPVNENDFGLNSALPAIIGQLLWARDNALQYFGWTDIMASNTIEGGAPPSLHRSQIGWEQEIGIYPNIGPYSFFLPLNLISENSGSDIKNSVVDICLDKANSLFQTNLWSNNFDPSLDLGYFIRADINGIDNAHYFGTLDQFYILGSIFNYFRNQSDSSKKDFRYYFYSDYPLETECQQIHLNQGWSGISSRIDPFVKSMEVIFSDIEDSLIIIKDFDGFYYPAENVNTLGDWDTQKGYSVKVTDTCVHYFNGLENENRTVLLSEGWNYLPVIGKCNVDVEWISAALSNMQIIKDVAGTNVYWPEYGINSLVSVQPGLAYFIRLNEAGSYTFTECDGLKSETMTVRKGQNLTAPPIAVGIDLSEFGIAKTAFTHVVAIPKNSIENSAIKPGNYIAVFNQAGQCFGICLWENYNTTITVFGDDPTTQAKDGFVDGEKMLFSVFGPAIGKEYALEAVYDKGLPNHNGLFYVNGLSAISSFKLGSTEISGPESFDVLIYPNPTSDMVYIDLEKQQQVHVGLYDIHGQEVLKQDIFNLRNQLDISKLKSGVYIIKLEGLKKLKAERLVKM